MAGENARDLTRDAFRYLEKGHGFGKVVVIV